MKDTEKFLDKLEDKVIPAIGEMIKKETSHLSFLETQAKSMLSKGQGSAKMSVFMTDSIQRSKSSLEHLRMRLLDYSKYVAEQRELIREAKDAEELEGLKSRMVNRKANRDKLFF